jgi:signal transduction histidine kinase
MVETIRAATTPRLAGVEPRFSLSQKLLLLVVAFVMVGELVILIPSIARFRESYLQQRLANAHLATLALDATPDKMVSEELSMMLLDLAEVRGVVLRKGNGPRRVLSSSMPPKVDVSTDLDNSSWLQMIGDAMDTLVNGGDRVLRVMGMSPKDAGVQVEILLDEAPLRQDMLAYAERILLLSVAVSVLTALLLYSALRWLIVRPLQAMTEEIESFRRDPESDAALPSADGRGDEIGIVEHALLDMQRTVRSALRQKTNLATLGTAVAKINHDLRNVLSTAQLLSDYLERSDDPKVRKVAPSLMRAIDRAVALCTDTLNFTSEQPQPVRGQVDLAALLEELECTLRPEGEFGRNDPERDSEKSPVQWRVDIAKGFTVWADREQLFRVLLNVVRNALQSGAQRVLFSARRGSDGAGQALATIDIFDNGPGLSPRAQENLFRPFAGRGRPGGTGLGLAIARDLMHAHGGDIVLARTGADGTIFRLTLPDAPKNGRH